jgi:hypothetical protein
MGNPLKQRLKAYAKSREIRRIRHQAEAMPDAARGALLSRLSEKSIVFAVASGRSGTQTLAKIFEAVSGVHATHEGIPAFQDVMREAMGDPALARAFLLTRKLPAIAACPEPIYLESSHVFAKGFLPPVLELGLKPKLIFLKRDPRKIALSLERIGATPLRTRGGREHFLSPADPSFLPVQPWGDFTDYQLCYWYALETMRRQQILREMALAAGLACRVMRIEELESPDDVWALMSELGLPVQPSAEATEALRARTGRAFNQKQKSPPLLRKTADLETQEQAVIDRVQASIPELNVRRMISQYLQDGRERSEGTVAPRRAARG